MGNLEEMAPGHDPHPRFIKEMESFDGSVQELPKLRQYYEQSKPYDQKRCEHRIRL